MRVVLLMIVIVAIAALIQSKRHGCKLGDDDWWSCVVDNTRKEYYSALSPDVRLGQLEADDARASAM